MAEVFDPAEFPALIALGQHIRELAGETAYRAGRDYLRKGMVQEPVVSGPLAQAIVKGSTDYRVSLGFAGAAAAKVTCTCPAHRRTKHCKHVVAVAVAIVEQPRLFVIIPPSEIPVVAPPQRKRRDPAAKQKAEDLKEDQRRAGLLLVDRVLDELAESGLSGLGPEQVTLLASVAETVLGLKLRRLGNGLIAVRRLAIERANDETAPTEFASLLQELILTRQVIGAVQAGQIELDAAFAEELIGKTWRASELAPVSGLNLVTVARETHDDGEFRVESMYLVDLGTHELFVERQITPLGLRGQRFLPRRFRTLVDEAGIYPGVSPRRIKLIATHQAELLMSDVDQVIDAALSEVSAVRSQLVERLAVPVASEPLVVLFRPAGIVAIGDRLALVDDHGETLPVVLPESWPNQTVRGMTRDNDRFVCVGFVELADAGLHLRCMALFGDLGWASGPNFPELA